MLLFTCIIAWTILVHTFATKSIPDDWQARVNTLNAFYAENDEGILGADGYPQGLYLPTIGNGYLSHSKGVRSDTMFVSGVFNGETTSPSHRAALPAQLAITVKDSKAIGALLDIEEGTYSRRGYLSSTSSSWYELKWYAHRHIRSLYILEATVHLVDEEGDIVVNIESNSLKNSPDFSLEPVELLNGGRTQKQCGTTLIPEVAGGSTSRVCVVADVIPRSVTLNAAKNKKQTFHFITSTRTSLDSSDAEEAAINDYKMGAHLAHKGGLFQAHVDEWKKLWTSGIEIGGRPDVGKAVNASMYAILSSVRTDWPYGLAPGGLTNSYNGHSFWDTETWMYPPLLVLHPDLAESLIQYRFDRLEGAKMKAASYTPAFAGTMFPWESAFSGVETCPTFAATGLREDHISGDISFAIWQEWNLLKDRQWLEKVAYPILTGVADFWVSRATYRTESDGSQTAHILDIIPPDEYVDHVNDSVYSNYVASLALQYAVEASKELNITCDRCATYTDLSQKLVILFDETQKIHPEYENYPGNTVKQADVVLLHYPLSLEMSDEIRRNDLEYYSTRTDTHGPAMTWGMHAIGYLDLNDADQASKFFNLSFQDNMHEPLQVWTETPDGNACNFITGAGGFLQTMIFGYPGLRITSTGLSFNPKCPEGASYVKLRSVHYLDRKFDLEYTCDASSSSLLASSVVINNLSYGQVAAPRVRAEGLEVQVLGEKREKSYLTRELVGEVKIDLQAMRESHGNEKMMTLFITASHHR